MMNNYFECCQKYNIVVDKIKIFPFYTLIYGKNNYVITKYLSVNPKLLDYFNSINYDYYLPLIGSYNDLYLYPYYEEEVISSQEKAEKFLNTIGDLHQKSMVYECVSKEYITNFYQNIEMKIHELEKYYFNLQDKIEEESFIKLDSYFLLKNISIFYEVLNLSMNKLVLWYQEHSLSIRKCHVIHNSSLNNFCFNSSFCYCFDYSKCAEDLLIYDLVEFYRDNSLDLDVVPIINNYQQLVSFTEEEWNLFFCLILIPKKIDFLSSNYDNILSIKNEIDYLEKTIKFVLEKDEKNQKTYKDKFEE